MRPAIRPIAAVLLWVFGTAAGAAAAGTGFSGESSLAARVFAGSASGREGDAEGALGVAVKHERRLGRVALLASLRAELRRAAERGALAFDPADRRRQRSPLSLRELSLRVPVAAAVDLQAGRFLLGWGKTDGYSPADAFLPRDATDPFADEKLPLCGARLSGQRGALRFDALAVAVTTPWRLPELGGRYAPVRTPGVRLGEGVSRPPRQGFAAVRLLATAGPWDLGVWMRAGVRPAPLLEFRSELAYPDPDGDGAVVPVDRHHPHEHGAGFEASRVTGAWVLRGELGVLRSRAAALGQAWLLSVGAERAFGDATLLLTFAANLEDPPGNPALLFDRAFLPGLIAAWNVSTGWGSWKLVYTHAFEHGDGLLRAEAVRNLDDHWSLAGAIDWPRGPERGPLGALHRARRLTSTLRHRW